MRRSAAMKCLNVLFSASPACVLKNFNWPLSCASMSIASILPRNRRASTLTCTRKLEREATRRALSSESPPPGTGFEPSVPRQEKWSMPSSSDQTRVGRTLTLGGGTESSLEGRDIELSVSPKDIRTSPYDLCANRSDRRQSREGDRWVRIHFPPAASLL